MNQAAISRKQILNKIMPKPKQCNEIFFISSGNTSSDSDYKIRQENNALESLWNIEEKLPSWQSL
jgi:hypothetical protein